MWLRVIKSIKTLTSCNPIFHFVHTHKCLIKSKLNTKKFERPNLYILFSLHRIDVISQRNYKAPLLRNAHLLICLSSVATHSKFWWQAFPAFKARSFVLLGSTLCPGATGTHSAVPQSWTNDPMSRSAGEGLSPSPKRERRLSAVWQWCQKFSSPSSWSSVPRSRNATEEIKWSWNDSLVRQCWPSATPACSYGQRRPGWHLWVLNQNYKHKSRTGQQFRHIPGQLLQRWNDPPHCPHRGFLQLTFTDVNWNSQYHISKCLIECLN